MYLIPVEIRESTIDGKGVFALSRVPKNTIVWKFYSRHDKALSRDAFNAFDEEKKQELKRVAYLSRTSNRYIYPPENDPTNFTNHSKNNNLSSVYNKSISEEPYFVANRDIEVGEEITNDYSEFDEALEADKPEWI